MVPDPGEYATEFRERVRAYHARRNQKLVVGQIIKLTNGESYKITRLKPLQGYKDRLFYKFRVGC